MAHITPILLTVRKRWKSERNMAPKVSRSMFRPLEQITAQRRATNLFKQINFPSRWMRSPTMQIWFQDPSTKYVMESCWTIWNIRQYSSLQCYRPIFFQFFSETLYQNLEYIRKLGKQNRQDLLPKWRNFSVLSADSVRHLERQSCPVSSSMCCTFPVWMAESVRGLGKQSFWARLPTFHLLPWIELETARV